MKLLSKQTGELTIVSQLPQTMKQYEIPASVCHYIQGRFGHLIFQEIDIGEIVIRFADILPDATENAFLKDEVLVVEENEAIVCTLSLSGSQYYHIDGVGDIEFHERSFNMYAMPPMVSSFVVGRSRRSEVKIFISLPLAEEIAVSYPQLDLLLTKAKKHKPATLTRYPQVANWPIIDLTDRLRQASYVSSRHELVAYLLHSVLEIAGIEKVRKPPLLTREDRDIIYSIRNTLFANLDKSYTRKELLEAHKALKPYKFEKGFHEIYGKSAFALLTEQRMKVAADLLQDERYLTLTEIASETGYSDSSPFVKAFYRFFGLYPEKFRQNQKKNY